MMIDMKKRHRKRMGTILALVGVLLVGAVLFLGIPYSPTAARFKGEVAKRVRAADTDPEMFTEEDLRDLPPPMQRYIRHCGYLGTPKMSSMRTALEGVDFRMSKDRTIPIDYAQLNLADRPERFALITSSLYGIPFEGLDSFAEGAGSMEGVLAKVIRLFNQRGEQMNRAGLVTWLAESPMVPSAMLQDFITWEVLDDDHVRAMISYNGMSAEGVFTLEGDEIRSFRTGDRVATGMDGSEQFVEWSALFEEYRAVDGILRPSVIRSVWHYPEGDSVYFNENKRPVDIRFQ